MDSSAIMARSGDTRGMNPYVYDIVLWFFSLLLDLFFREVHPRSSWKIPKTGPVIFVAAPHANQFVDPLVLFRVIRYEAKRRVAFLIAAKSVKRKEVAMFSQRMGSVPVGRALDETKPAKGRVYVPDPDNDPTLLRGIDTNFEDGNFQVGGLIVLPSVKNVAANTEIAEILGPQEIRLKKPFKGDIAVDQLGGKEYKADGSLKEQQNDEQGTKFKVAPKIDQSKVYEAVFERLALGGCVGIFPEGGSHDRTELLPLKGETK
jgi:glycerol-3-phosphate O-acyltransferase/dihydroxyacetone phosphate acyltransferase